MSLNGSVFQFFCISRFLFYLFLLASKVASSQTLMSFLLIGVFIFVLCDSYPRICMCSIYDFNFLFLVSMSFYQL